MFFTFYIEYSDLGSSRSLQHSLPLAGHPFRGWPARLRGHKGSGLWKVWTVPSPPLPLPSLPPSRVPCRRNGNQPNLPERMSQCSAAWRSRSENEANPPCPCENAAETVFFLSGITRAVIRIGTNEWPIAHPTG